MAVFTTNMVQQQRKTSVVKSLYRYKHENEVEIELQCRLCCVRVWIWLTSLRLGPVQELQNKSSGVKRYPVIYSHFN